MKKVFLLLLGLFLLNSPVFAKAEITSALAEAILMAQKTGTNVKAIMVLEDQYDILALDRQLSTNKASLQERAFTVITNLKNHANRTQANLVNFLESKTKSEIPLYQNFWITNVITIEAQPDVLLDLASRNDISQMDLDTGLQLIEPVERRTASSLPNSAEPGLKVINADKLWKMGITGKGVIVMNLDSGVDGTHPALALRWRGNDPGVPASAAWFDALENTSFPVDPFYGAGGHGTHTMGTITGLNAADNDTIGVAFDAKWIASRFITSENYGFGSGIMYSFQWALDPDGYPDTYNDMPAVISNSWGGGNLCTPFYQFAMDALETAGIALVFAAGNGGPDSSTVLAPAMINKSEMNVFSVGALNGNLSQLPIAQFSSRGPTFCTGSGNQIKPEVSAPGVDVRSSVPNGGYEYWSGTSMATPHVAGAIALLKQVFPGRTGAEIKQMLYDNATDLGSSGEDNDYGMGVIDVYAALLANISLTNPMPPSEVSAYSDYQTTTSTIITWDDPVSSVGGDLLFNFEIELWRDNQFLTTINQGVENYIDTQLSDGQQYEYKLYTHDLTSDSISDAVIVSVYAGGSPFPSPPTNLSCQVEGDSVLLQWDDPIIQTDGTPLDDLDKILIYRDGDSIVSVPPGVESFVDYPLPGSTAFYSLQAVDNEAPQHYSAQTDSVECFIGTTPDYLVWVGNRAVLSTIASADSLFYAIAANGRSVFLTNDLFEFGTDLSIFKAIFVVLGQFSHSHILLQNDPEPPALEAYLLKGGKLYLEGGVCFNADPSNPDDIKYNINPWFSLAYTDAYTNSLPGIQGLNYFSNFSFSLVGHSGLLNVFLELLPIDSTPIWENDSTGAVCGVWYVGPGSGMAIGVVPGFGDLEETVNKVTNTWNQLNLPIENFFTSDIQIPDLMTSENSLKFVKRYANKPELKSQRKQSDQLLNFFGNGMHISAGNKTDLMAAYLALMQSNPAHAIYGRTNSAYFLPGTDTVWITSKIVNPDNQQISVQAVIEYLDHTIVDSIPLFDDGSHNDSTAGDGVYGGSWHTRPEEQTYLVNIQIYLQSLGINRILNNAVRFTTIGPVLYDGYHDFGLSSSPPYPYFGFKLLLKNMGLVSPAKSVSAEIVLYDTFLVKAMENNNQSFGDINPGETRESPQWYFFYVDSIPHNLDFEFKLNIYSNGNLFWQGSNEVIVGLKTADFPVVKTYALYQNYPNPFNPITTIEFDIPKTSEVTLKIFDILGEEVATLVSDRLSAGSYSYEWDASQNASGVYIYRLKAGNYVETRKMILMK
jgi:hypothetical protein